MPQNIDRIEVSMIGKIRRSCDRFEHTVVCIDGSAGRPHLGKRNRVDGQRGQHGENQDPAVIFHDGFSFERVRTSPAVDADNANRGLDLFVVESLSGQAD
jgi:hypothetical protein